MLHSQLIRLPLLVLFVLLQSVAPLAHAHVDGNHGEYDGQGVHLNLSDPAWSNENDNHHDHDLVPHHLLADSHQSVAVSIQTEFRDDDLLLEQPAVISGRKLLGQTEPKAVLFLAFQLQTLPLFPCQHPCSQAPPV
jgi:hypothetical protein